MYCNNCKGQFTVAVGTVFERSKIPLTKWWMAIFLLGSSKKGMSARQIHRMLGVTYKTAWFMMHRIREAMRDMGHSGPLGGEGKVVEADETFVGGKAKNRAYAPPPKKRAVAALVERKGYVRSYHVANVTTETLRPIMVKIASRKSHLMTDESNVYIALGREFASHGTVNHSANEYVRGNVHTNTLEGYFSIVKRGIYGIYQHVSEAHLHRYLTEFDFRYNTRAALGIDDTERSVRILQGIEGKRLTYRRPHEAAHA